MSEGLKSLKWYLFRTPEPSEGKSSPIQKGLVCSFEDGAADLCEEGLGFGVPVLQYRRDFVFPGRATSSVHGKVVQSDLWKEFDLNLVERHQKGDSSRISMFSWVLQRIYNWLYTSSYARYFQRGISWAWKGLRLKGKIQGEVHPVFFQVPSYGKSRVSYRISNTGREIKCEVDLMGIQEQGYQFAYLHNELGALVFDTYFDSSGLILRRNDISGWDRIHAEKAGFYSPQHRLSFIVDIPDNVQAYRGREVIGDTIRWSGIIFKTPSNVRHLNYRVRFVEGFPKLEE